MWVSYGYIYIFVYARYELAAEQSELNFDFSHFDLVHAQSTKLVELGTQQSLCKEVGNIVLGSDELDSELSALDVVTVLEESHLHVFVFARRLRIVRSEDRCQIVTVQW